VFEDVNAGGRARERAGWQLGASRSNKGADPPGDFGHTGLLRDLVLVTT
jgi:hypothetical protein